MTIRIAARAKVNLCLHVTGQRGDGYHLLDSVVTFADVADILTFKPAENLTLTIDGPFADGLSGDDDNLILQAARCFANPAGAKIHLQKNLPVASGIGGGSADAAAALLGLSQLWNCDLPDAAVQLSLGADVPVCVVGETVRMQGVGEDLSPITGLPALPAILINPGIAVSTPSVFKALAKKNNTQIGAGEASLDWLSAQRNDLQEPATSLAPMIAEVVTMLEESSALLARMSGSGATCFGIFRTMETAQAVAAKLSEKHPDWWVQATTLNRSNDA
ncbi:MAG: 4-(cytidine 5'-diphospho)-2-C-methyl-D-erythritol kinase [Rhodobacteraceae bacterium]|nr:4-(cytidine 5'-diphospho)-2-C-methyl-D-erythritol kinase [Paracoccaceae bacterium]